MSDNFDLHKYLKNNPLLKESVEIDEMARISAGFVPVEDWEEKWEALDDSKKKSSPFVKAKRYLDKISKEGSTGTVADLRDQEFNGDNPPANTIKNRLIDLGIIKTTGLITPKKEKELKGDGAKGRPTTDKGYIKSAMQKINDDTYNFTEKEVEALKNLVKTINTAIKKSKD
jgi:hypothetical protein